MQKNKCSCIDKYIALKDIITLMSNAKEPYNVMDVEYVKGMIIPPIELNQFKIFYRDKRPVGYTTWGFLDKKAEKKLINNEEYFTKSDWKSGKHYGTLTQFVWISLHYNFTDGHKNI